MADLQVRAALVAYAGIFPPGAPKPGVGLLTDRWREWLSEPTGRTVGLVAEEDGDVVGIVLAGPAPGQARTGHLAKLYVAPARWGRGIGSELYRAAMCHLRGQGFTEASLWVLEGNHRARSWYERLGWIQRGGFRDAYHSVREVSYVLSLPSLSARVHA